MFDGVRCRHESKDHTYGITCFDTSVRVLHCKWHKSECLLNFREKESKMNQVQELESTHTTLGHRENICKYCCSETY